MDDRLRLTEHVLFFGIDDIDIVYRSYLFDGWCVAKYIPLMKRGIGPGTPEGSSS
jgi:hypothetical protein